MTKKKDSYRAALYIRLSKEDGDKQESNSITNQRKLLYAFLKHKPEIRICSEHVDDGYSGIHFDRPGVRQLLQEVREGFVDCIIVKDLSRFGRDYIETGRFIQQIFPFMGVRFIAVNDNYDSIRQDNQAESMILPFKNLLNDAYCRDISMKVRSQLKVRRERGDYIGNFPVFGYKKDPKNRGRLVIDETAAGIVREIFSMKLAGHNNQQITEYLNRHGVPSPMEYKMLSDAMYSTSFKLKLQTEWYPAAVERILKNEIYTGTMVQGKERTLNYKIKKRIRTSEEEWVRVESVHAPIVSKEEYALVKNLLFRDTRTAPGEQELSLFAGLLFCADCGQSMVRRKLTVSGKIYQYYICSSNKRDKTVCSSHRIREDILSEAVLCVLRAHILLVGKSMESLHREDKVRKQELMLKLQRQRLSESQRRGQELYKDYKDGLLCERDYMELKEEYEAVRTRLEEAVQLLEEETVRLKESFADTDCEAESDRRLLCFLIDRIFIYGADRICINVRYKDELAQIIRGEV